MSRLEPSTPAVLAVAILSAVFLASSCSSGRPTPSPAGQAAWASYGNTRAGFAVRYDPRRLTAPTESSSARSIAVRFVANGPVYRGRLTAIGLADRNQKDRLGSALGGVEIDVFRASRPILLPRTEVLLRAKRLLFLSEVAAVGSSGTRTVAPVLISGLAGVKLTMAWGDLRAEEYWLSRGNTFYRLQFRATTAAWPGMAPIYDALAKSFQLEPKLGLTSTWSRQAPQV